MMDQLPHIVVSCGLGLEYAAILVGNVADAAIDRAAIQGDLITLSLGKKTRVELCSWPHLQDFLASFFGCCAWISRTM